MLYKQKVHTISPTTTITSTTNTIVHSKSRKSDCAVHRLKFRFRCNALRPISLHLWASSIYNEQLLTYSLYKKKKQNFTASTSTHITTYYMYMNTLLCALHHGKVIDFVVYGKIWCCSVVCNCTQCDTLIHTKAPAHNS